MCVTPYIYKTFASVGVRVVDVILRSAQIASEVPYTNSTFWKNYQQLCKYMEP